MKNVVIVGYGQLGTEVCKHHIANGDKVYSLSRSQLTSNHKQHYHFSVDLDLLQQSLNLPSSIDVLYYFAPPGNSALSDERLKRFLLYHQCLKITHIIYISTSGVYGNSNGQWINEQAAVNPTAERAKRRLDAEQQLLSYSHQHPTAVTILRCAAIYSANTVNKQRIAANKKPVIKASQAPFTNRIHLQDLTEVCLCAMYQPAEMFEIYNVSDGHPSTTTDHAWLLADLAGLERNPEIDLSEASQYYSEAYMSYLNESKRLDISRLLSKLKPVFKFQNTAAGIKACLTEKN